MKFVIDRKTWRRGSEKQGFLKIFGDTRLLNKEGYMCCLGQIALQCGVPKEEIIGRVYPQSVHEEYESYHTIFEGDTLGDDAMKINDDPVSSEEYREQRLIELFASRGHELQFVG